MDSLVESESPLKNFASTEKSSLFISLSNDMFIVAEKSRRFKGYFIFAHETTTIGSI